MEFQCLRCEESFEYSNFKGYENLILHRESNQCSSCDSSAVEAKQYAKKTKNKDVIELQFDFGDKGFISPKGKVYTRGYRFLAYQEDSYYATPVLAQKLVNGIVYNGFINFYGSEIIPFCPQEEIEYYLFGFKEETCGFYKADGERGFIDKEGKVVSEWDGTEITFKGESFRSLSSFYVTEKYSFDDRKLSVEERALEQLEEEQKKYLSTNELQTLLKRIK